MAAKKALIVWGGWEGHTPKESAEVFAPILQAKGYEVEVSITLDSYLDKDKMAALNLIVPVWTMGTITKEQEKGLLDAVRGGAGIAGFHGGIIDSFRNNTAYQWMTGGQWVAHPGNCIPNYRVMITDHSHEITHGIPDFDLPDTEQYWVHVDPQNHVLATTTFSGGYGEPDMYKRDTVMPYCWTKTWGKGRVFVACWGHTFKDFQVAEALEIVQRGMLWASK
jgi:uncharacterized protein